MDLFGPVMSLRTVSQHSHQSQNRSHAHPAGPNNFSQVNYMPSKYQSKYENLVSPSESNGHVTNLDFATVKETCEASKSCQFSSDPSEDVASRLGMQSRTPRNENLDQEFQREWRQHGKQSSPETTKDAWGHARRPASRTPVHLKPSFTHSSNTEPLPTSTSRKSSYLPNQDQMVDFQRTSHQPPFFMASFHSNPVPTPGFNSGLRSNSECFNQNYNTQEALPMRRASLMHSVPPQQGSSIGSPFQSHPSAGLSSSDDSNLYRRQPYKRLSFDMTNYESCSPNPKRGKLHEETSSRAIHSTYSDIPKPTSPPQPNIFTTSDSSENEVGAALVMLALAGSGDSDTETDCSAPSCHSTPENSPKFGYFREASVCGVPLTPSINEVSNSMHFQTYQTNPPPFSLSTLEMNHPVKHRFTPAVFKNNDLIEYNNHSRGFPIMVAMTRPSYNGCSLPNQPTAFFSGLHLAPKMHPVSPPTTQDNRCHNSRDKFARDNQFHHSLPRPEQSIANTVCSDSEESSPPLPVFSQHKEASSNKSVSEKYESKSSPEIPTRRRGRKRLDKTGLRCHNCGTTETPEWRRGPSGPSTLCNSCGIKYASRIKKELELSRKAEMNATVVST